MEWIRGAHGDRGDCSQDRLIWAFASSRIRATQRRVTIFNPGRTRKRIVNTPQSLASRQCLARYYSGRVSTSSTVRRGPQVGFEASTTCFGMHRWILGTVNFCNGNGHARWEMFHHDAVIGFTGVVQNIPLAWTRRFSTVSPTTALVLGNEDVLFEMAWHRIRAYACGVVGDGR